MTGPKGIDFYIGDGTPSLAGETFIVIKASEGVGYPPPGAPENAWYPQEQARIRATGAVFGAYLFWHPGDDNAAQLANFQRHAGLRPGDVMQLDAEVTDGLDWGTVNARKNDMLARAKAELPQCRVLLYTYLDYWNHLDGNAGDGLWIADPNSPAGQPRVPHWVFHQYASSGVDYDVANFPDAAALRVWATGLIPKPPVPTPTPTPAPLEGLPVKFIAAVKADPANPTVNQGIWYYDFDNSYFVHLGDPFDVAGFAAAGTLTQHDVTFATHERVLAAAAASPHIGK